MLDRTHFLRRLRPCPDCGALVLPPCPACFPRRRSYCATTGRPFFDLAEHRRLAELRDAYTPIEGVVLRADETYTFGGAIQIASTLRNWLDPEDPVYPPDSPEAQWIEYLVDALPDGLRTIAGPVLFGLEPQRRYKVIDKLRLSLGFPF